MDSQIIDGLIFYIGLIILLTFHEFAHAWTSHKCGDDTARLQGRLTLNPIAHIDPLGTVLFPLLIIFLPILGFGGTFSGFMVGWAKPVPVNPSNLGNPVRDDILIALAGPAMNFVLAVLLVGAARVAVIFNSEQMTEFFINTASLSLLLCFFNLIPVPPLDGSHVLRNFIGMSWEAYWNLCRYGFIFVIVVINIPGVRNALAWAVETTLILLGKSFHFPLN